MKRSATRRILRGDTVGPRYTAPKISAISYLFRTFSLLIMGDRERPRYTGFRGISVRGITALQCMFSLRNKKNYRGIIGNAPSNLELCNPIKLLKPFGRCLPNCFFFLVYCMFFYEIHVHRVQFLPCEKNSTQQF